MNIPTGTYLLSRPTIKLSKFEGKLECVVAICNTFLQNSPIKCLQTGVGTVINLHVSFSLTCFLFVNL